MRNVMNKPGVYEGNDPFIFISYCHKDSNRVYPILNQLQNRGFRIWYDDGIEMGQFWAKRVYEHIVSSTLLIAFVSQNYLDSEHCLDEIAYCKNKKRNISIVYLDNIEEMNIPGEWEMQYNRIEAIFYFPMLQNDFFSRLQKAENIMLCKIKDEITDKTIMNEDDYILQVHYSTLKKWKDAILETDQQIHWNVSTDIFERAAFYINRFGHIIWGNIFTGYNIKQISKISTHVGSMEDDAYVSLYFDNGDILSFGSCNYINKIRLENKSTKLILISSEEITSYWLDSNGYSTTVTQTYNSWNDVAYVWKHCCSYSNMEEIAGMLSYSDDGYLIIKSKKTEYMISDILEMKYYNYVSPDDSNDFEKEISIKLNNKTIIFYESAYSSFRIDEY